MEKQTQASAKAKEVQGDAVAPHLLLRQHTSDSNKEQTKLSKYERVKGQVYLLLDPTDGGTVWDKIVNGLIVVLILLNILAVAIETVESIYQSYKAFFTAF